jgi:hypothetical protein
MFTVPTVLIIGAGASAAAGLPLGPGLAERIAEKANDRDFRRAVTGILHQRSVQFPSPSIVDGLEAISQGVRLSRSIDRFIEEYDHHPAVRSLGKILIADEILAAEASSRVAQAIDGFGFVDVYNSAVAKCWYGDFAAKWLGDVKHREVQHSNHNLRVVSFNYDRVFELYLTSFILKKYRGLDPSAASSVVSSLRVIHPYGSLGTLPNFPLDFGARPVPFGGESGQLSYSIGLSEGLRTFGESQASAVADEVKGVLQNAAQIIFLGFSFERMNMNLLELAGRQGNRPFVYASAYGVSEAAEKMNRQLIASTLKTGENMVQYRDMTCETFVPHFAPTWQ